MDLRPDQSTDFETVAATVASKQNQRDEIAQQVEKFLQRQEIEKIPTGMSAETYVQFNNCDIKKYSAKGGKRSAAQRALQHSTIMRSRSGREGV